MRLHQKVGDGREVNIQRGELHMAQVGGGQVLQGHLALHIQAASNVQIGVLDIPREVLFNILSFLNPLDPCSILSINLFCKDLFDKESVWISKAKLDFIFIFIFT